MKNLLTFFLLLIFEMGFAQKILSKYPDGQFPYLGGYPQMFAEMQDYFVKSGLKTCGKNELYWVTLKIDETGKPFLIKKKSGKEDGQFRCASDLAVQSIGSLKNWNAAEESGRKVSAYFDFPFFPQDFFGNFKPDYDITTEVEPAEFPGGINAYRKEIVKSLTKYIDYGSYRPNGRFTVFLVVEKDGKISDIDIEPKIPNRELFYEDVTTAFKKIKTPWKPTKVKGISIKNKFRFPLNFTTEVD
jgi:hypothetical protein